MTKDEIIEIAIQAGWDEHHAKFDLRIKKFAELIVRECAEIGDGYDNETKYNQGLIDIQTAGDEIRKHFGVEE